MAATPPAVIPTKKKNTLNKKTQTTKASAKQPTVVSSGPKELFPLGESLYYQINWKKIVGAHGRIRIGGKEKIDGRDTLVFEADLKTVPFVDTFFKIRDRVKSYWDPNAKKPVRTEKVLSEGHYRKFYVAKFFEPNSVTFSRRQYKGNTKKLGKKNKKAKWKRKTKTRRKLHPKAQDILTAIYYLRTMGPLPAKGKKVSIPVFDNGHKGKLKFQVLGREKITVPAGTFDAVLLKPRIKKRHFKNKGKVRIWLSDDERKIPLKVKANVKWIGALNLELTRIQNDDDKS